VKKLTRMIPVAFVAATFLLAACGGGGGGSPTAISTGSSRSHSSSSISPPTTRSTSSSSDTSSPTLVACALFDLKSLDDQTGLTWTIVDRTKNDSCVLTSNDGSSISLGFSPTGGQNDAALSGGKSACDAGTLTSVNVVNGGYVCEISGTASAGALFSGDNVMVVASSVSTNGASTQVVEGGLIAILKSFTAP
jgi:hypothetical protein